MKSNVTNTQKHVGEKHAIVIGAILSYSNPLHHPTRDNIMMRANTGYPVNYSTESGLVNDPFIKSSFFSSPVDPDDDQDEENTPSKEDENIDVPDNTDGENAVPDTENPDKAKDDIATA